MTWTTVTPSSSRACDGDVALGTADEALVKVDGTIFTPAITSFGGASSPVGTPAIDSGLRATST